MTRTPAAERSAAAAESDGGATMSAQLGTWELDSVVHTDALSLLRGLPDGSINCLVTSPPYFGLRDYGVEEQLGLEETPEQYVAALVAVFREARRVLRDDGTLWLNLGDSFANDGKWGGSTGGKHVSGLHGNSGIGRGKKHTGLKPKDLIGIPWMVAFALRADDWYLRSDIIWHKPNCMPESVTDRCTKSHEYVFLLSKCADYYYDNEAIAEATSTNSHGGKTPNAHKQQALGRNMGKTTLGIVNKSRRDSRLEPLTERNKRSVWTIPTQSFHGAHFAVMPEKLVEPCILAGCPVGGVVLDPFMGSGTVGLVARKLGRHYIGSEINADYVAMARDRLRLPFEPRQVSQNDDVSHLPMFAAVQP